MMDNRLLPQNIEAEQSILASCLYDHESAECALDSLQPEDFYRTAHQKIYRVIKNLRSNGTRPDLVTTVTELRNSGELEEIGGAAYVSSLLDEHPIAPNVPEYANYIKNTAQARKFIEISRRGEQAIYESNGNLPEILDSVQSQILQIGLDMKSEKFMTMRDLTLESMERYADLRDQKRERGIKTGYESVDNLTGGFVGSKLIIIAARPKIGKTAWALALARNIAKRGHMVGFFELEMDREDIDDRWMAMETGINSMQFATGTGPDNKQWPIIEEASGRKYQWPIIVDDTGNQSIGELKRRIRKMVHMGCKIVFIDQLSKIRPTDKRKGSWETNTEHVVELKQATKELKIPIVLLVQLNRDVERRKPPIPTAADFKLTGAIEEEADMAFLGYRRFPYTKKLEDKNHAWWELALNRVGPTRKIIMHFEPKTTMFTEKEGL